MKFRRHKIRGCDATYHCITRTVNGERLFGNREKEVLRKMLWQLADFSGVEILTYCVMSNHFHVLVRVPYGQVPSDAELLRRYRVLYPKPTKYQTASIAVLEKQLAAGGERAEAIRRQLLARMGDVSEYMKGVKQRFSVWYNRSHDRFGTLWAERFKSVLVEGQGNPLQAMAAYIDLNPVRGGLVDDPKDYRFCGYAEAVASAPLAVKGLRGVWVDHLGGSGGGDGGGTAAVLKAHRMLLYGQGSSPWTHKGKLIRPEQAVKVLEAQDGELPKAAALRCRVRYFTDGAILGSAEFVRSYVDAWQVERRRKYPPKVNPMQGGLWGDMAVIQAPRKQVLGYYDR